MNVIIDWQSDVPPTEEEEKYIREMVFSSDEYEGAKSEGKRLFTISVSSDQIKVIKREMTKNNKRTGSLYQAINNPEDLEINKPEDFYNLNPKEREILTNWIRANLKPIKSVNRMHTSYGLKHYFEHDLENKGFYIHNGQFKGAMLECGFKPYKELKLNWHFCISEKSITELEKRGLGGP